MSRKPQGKYTWSRHFAVSAQVFGQVYYDLKRRTPQELVRAARSPRSPVHRLFEWNNNRAAEAYRLLQAREMISSLRVEIIDAKGKATNILAFIRSSDRGRFVATLEATSEEVSAEMQKCWNEMLRFRSRYRGLEAASLVVEAIDETDRRLRRSRRKAA